MQAKRLLILIKLAESPQYIFPDYKIAASLSNGLLAKSIILQGTLNNMCLKGIVAGDSFTVFIFYVYMKQ